jgi:hypothetical protein
MKILRENHVIRSECPNMNLVDKCGHQYDNFLFSHCALRQICEFLFTYTYTEYLT